MEYCSSDAEAIVPVKDIVIAAARIMDIIFFIITWYLRIALDLSGQVVKDRPVHRRGSFPVNEKTGTA
jgi:hypothetical protein